VGEVKRNMFNNTKLSVNRSCRILNKVFRSSPAKLKNSSRLIVGISLFVVLFISAPVAMQDARLLVNPNPDILTESDSQLRSNAITRDAEAASLSNLPIVKTSANGYESGTTNYPQKAIDNRFDTRWSNYGKGSWIKLDLGQQLTVSHVDIAWYRGDLRFSYFTVSTSTDDSSYGQVFSGRASGLTTSLERYDFADKVARYVKITVNGNTENQWASISEIDVYGYPSFISISPPPASESAEDKFGIDKIYPTKSDGLEWYSSWDNGHARTFYDAIDPDDKWFDTDHGDGKYVIDGKGTLTASGSHVRMYVHDPAKSREWDENLEITVYITRISETKTLSYSGLQIFSRTNHGTLGNEDTNICDDRGYGAKIKTDGTWSFEKETAHNQDDGFADTEGKEPWSSLPKDKLIGVKYILRNMDDDTRVKLELYRDLTGGIDGGKWEKIYEFIDTGKNLGVGMDRCKSGVDPALQLIHSYILSSSETKKPMLTVYLRHEYGTMKYNDFSIREIGSLP
jgi:hypothetical protein